MQYLSLLIRALLASAAIMLAQAQVSPASAAAPSPGWRAVPYPNGGELRYRPPLVTDRDYPAHARDAGFEGTTLLRLEVNQEGQIVDCAVERSAGLAELDQAACQIYRARAGFQLRGISGSIILKAPVMWQLEIAEGDVEWPIGRPAQLLQAKGCSNTPPVVGEMLENQPGIMVALEALPACLQPAFKNLADRALAIASDPAARVVVRARVGRAWTAASLHYALPGSTWVRQPAVIDPIMDLLSSEWEDYASRDGELGWSGFLLLVEGGKVQVRLLSNESNPGDIWFNSNAIHEEFFRGLLFAPEKPATG